MRFVQLSDPHIVAPEKQPVGKFNTIHRLRLTVNAVNRLDPAPDFAVVTGDLTSDEQVESYEIIREILAGLETPYHPIPGNHDARIPFRMIMFGETDPQPDRIHKTFVHDGWRYILLDTLDEGLVTGVLDDQQLHWLEETLVSDEPLPTIVCMHHPPVDVGVTWMDDLKLQDASRLLDILDTHSNVRIVLCGHVHHIFEIDRGHYTIHTAPAVSNQFRKEPLPPPAERPLSYITDEPAAFRILDTKGDAVETSIYQVLGDV